MCLRMTLPIPRAGQSTAYSALRATTLSATRTDSIPGIPRSSEASGEYAPAWGSAKKALFGKQRPVHE